MHHYIRGIRLVVFTMALVSILAACGSTTATQSSSTTATTSSCLAVPSGQQAYTIVSQQSDASYQVQEKFLNRPLPNTAIGKTSTIKGSFLVRLGNAPAITSMNITVDLRTLTSDQDRRDNAIRGQWLESDTYPYATFVVKDAQALPANASDGQEVSFKITGDMTIHKVTRQETFTVKGKLVGKTITGTATALVYMKNYGFSAPDIFGLLTVTDGVTVTFNFTATQTNCAALQ